MVRRERNRNVVSWIPECSCNTRLNHILWKHSKSRPNIDAESFAKDHEELHHISRSIVDFIANTGKMQKEDIIEAFPDYNEGMLSMAANMSMYPIVFPKRRHAPPQEFNRLKKQAYQLTDEFRRLKYAPNDEGKDEEDNDK